MMIQSFSSPLLKVGIVSFLFGRMTDQRLFFFSFSSALFSSSHIPAAPPTFISVSLPSKILLSFISFSPWRNNLLYLYLSPSLSSLQSSSPCLHLSILSSDFPSLLLAPSPPQIIFSLSSCPPSIICFPPSTPLWLPIHLQSLQSLISCSLTPPIHPSFSPHSLPILSFFPPNSITTLNVSSFSFAQLSVVCAAMLILDVLSPLLLLSILALSRVCWAADIPEDATSEFSVRLYHQLQAAGDQDNIIFSPLSVAVALGMVELGARGASLEEIRQAVGFSHLLQGDFWGGYRSHRFLKLSWSTLGTEVILARPLQPI